MSKKYFIWHIRYVEGSKTTEDLPSAGNTGLLRPGGNLISLVHRVQLWRRVPDAQANLHGSAKNSQKKCRQEHYRNCRGVKYLSGPRCITASRQGLKRDIFCGEIAASWFFRDGRGVMLSFARMKSRSKDFWETVRYIEQVGWLRGQMQWLHLNEETWPVGIAIRRQSARL